MRTSKIILVGGFALTNKCWDSFIKVLKKESSNIETKSYSLGDIFKNLDQFFSILREKDKEITLILHSISSAVILSQIENINPNIYVILLEPNLVSEDIGPLLKTRLKDLVDHEQWISHCKFSERLNHKNIASNIMNFKEFYNKDLLSNLDFVLSKLNNGDIKNKLQMKNLRYKIILTQCSRSEIKFYSTGKNIIYLNWDTHNAMLDKPRELSSFILGQIY